MTQMITFCVYNRTPVTTKSLMPFPFCSRGEIQTCARACVRQFFKSWEKGHNPNGENTNTELLGPRGSPLTPGSLERGRTPVFPVLSFPRYHLSKVTPNVLD